jgi:hypothetical protein
MAKYRIALLLLCGLALAAATAAAAEGDTAATDAAANEAEALLAILASLTGVSPERSEATPFT